MTMTDMILRINDALRSRDTSDLEVLTSYVDGLLICEKERGAILALIETSWETIEELS